MTPDGRGHIESIAGERPSAAAAVCARCEALRVYTWRRLERCPFQEGKAACARCPSRYPKRAGPSRDIRQPRMLVRHPLLAVQHLADRLRREPVRRQRVRASAD
jgi:hypothetical protein